MSQPLYAPNLFKVLDKQGYLNYLRRSVQEVEAHGGRVVAPGKRPP